MARPVQPVKATGFDVEALIAKYRPAPEDYVLTLPGGERFTFRPWRTYREMSEFLARAVAWWQAFSQTPQGQGLKQDEAIAVYTIAETSVDPKIGQTDAIAIMQSCPLLFMSLRNAVDAANRSALDAAEAQEAVAAKNDSGQTCGDGCCLPSAETPCTDTSTSSARKSESD